jgi:hypothetical protein
VLVEVDVQLVARRRILLPQVALAEPDQVERSRREAVFDVG